VRKGPTTAAEDAAVIGSAGRTLMFRGPYNKPNAYILCYNRWPPCERDRKRRYTARDEFLSRAAARPTAIYDNNIADIFGVVRVPYRRRMLNAAAPERLRTCIRRFVFGSENLVCSHNII